MDRIETLDKPHEQVEQQLKAEQAARDAGGRIEHAQDVTPKPPEAQWQVDGSKEFDDNTKVEPRIEQDFKRMFGDGKVPGADKVIQEADTGANLERKGAELQMAVANELGPGGVVAMERDFYPPGKRDSPIDLVTSDNIVIECKNYDRIHPDTLENSFVPQAQSRLERSAFGAVEYRNAVIVVPDGKLTAQDSGYANDMSQHPRISICEQSELTTVLQRIRSHA